MTVGAGPSPPGSMSCPGTWSWCQGQPEGFLGPLMSPQDRQVMSLLLGAGTLHCDSVLPLPCHISPDSTDLVTAQQWGKQKCVKEGGKRCPVALPVLDGTHHPRSSRRQEAPGSSWMGPCVTRPVWLSVPEGPMFIYAHHFLPQGTLLLPNISALLPNFYHLFSRSWRRE